MPRGHGYGKDKIVVNGRPPERLESSSHSRSRFTRRDQVRVKPFALRDTMRLDLTERVPEATFHEATRTLNLAPEGILGADLPSWVEGKLRAAAGETEAVATMGA